MSDKIVFNESELAELLGCSVYTVQEHARAKKLPGLLYGNNGWIFPVDAVRAYLTKQALTLLESPPKGPKLVKSVSKGPPELPSI